MRTARVKSSKPLFSELLENGSNKSLIHANSQLQEREPAQDNFANIYSNDDIEEVDAPEKDKYEQKLDEDGCVSVKDFSDRELIEYYESREPTRYGAYFFVQDILGVKLVNEEQLNELLMAFPSFKTNCYSRLRPDK